jgi:hypothetical protein
MTTRAHIKSKGPSEATKWWLRQLDLRTVIFIMGGLISGFVAVAYFYKDSHENWDETKALKAVVALKADRDDLKAAIDRLNKMYDRFNKTDDDIDEIKEEMAEQKGYLKAYIEFHK